MYYESLSLYVNNATTKAALLSCGGVIEACLAVANDESEIRKAFAIVRPPGHHSEPSQAMGFCFFNNVAVACRVVQQETRVKRILIVDWYGFCAAYTCNFLISGFQGMYIMVIFSCFVLSQGRFKLDSR